MKRKGPEIEMLGSFLRPSFDQFTNSAICKEEMEQIVRKGYVHASMHEVFYCTVVLPKSNHDPGLVLESN